MHYSVRSAADLLCVTEDLIYDWIRNEDLPAMFFAGRYHLNKLKLIDWAHNNHLMVPTEGALTEPVLEDALHGGGILDNISGGNLEAVLKEIFCQRLNLEPQSQNKILEMLKTREDFGWSIDSQGIGMPDAGAPLVLLPESSRVYIAYVQPGSKTEGSKVALQALFIILVSNLSMHMNLLSRCSLALRDPHFQELIKSSSPAEQLLKRLSELSIKPVPLRKVRSEALLSSRK